MFINLIIMDKPIKYKRIEKLLNYNDEIIQDYLDELIKDGFEIIYYNEKEILDGNGIKLKITIIVCKKQSNII